MSYRFRTILFFSFVGIFFILTTIFSLYASGYKISLASILRGETLIQKTGVLVLDSKPKGAQVSLFKQFRGILSDNDILKSKKLTTPYKIKNLLPGEYVLNLELDGYWPFQQKITINPGLSTYLEDIILFKRNLPVRFLEATTQNIFLCSLDKKIILESDNKLVDLKSEQEISLGENGSSATFLSTGKIILDNSLIFDYQKNKYLDLSDDILSQSSKVKIKNDSLYYIKNGLNKYDFSSKKSNNIFSLENMLDYDFYNNFYFFLVKEDKNIVFNVYSQNQKNLLKSLNLPVSENSEIIPLSSSSNFVYVYDKDFRKIYVINTSSKFNSPWAVVDNVSGFNFVDANNFIYYSGAEIYMFNSSLAEKFLVGRFGSEIKSLVWHPKNYIIYSTNKEIVILDLKYEKQAINLVSLDKVGNLALDKLGSVLYFTGKIGNQEGLYKLFIQ